MKIQAVFRQFVKAKKYLYHRCYFEWGKLSELIDCAKVRTLQTFIMIAFDSKLPKAACPFFLIKLFLQALSRY